MPMIDVYADSTLFPKESRKMLGLDLTKAVLRAEGVAQPGMFHLRNTAAFLHLMEEGTITTAAGDDLRNVRVQIITPPNTLSRPGQIQLVREISGIIAKHARDPSQAERTWVVLTEAAEGGWGIAGTAYGKSEFLALAKKAAEASPANSPANS
jgi:phenylpyruvate tautomerase PptA (4-oxalocrotonate tautomerase family)